MRWMGVRSRATASVGCARAAAMASHICTSAFVAGASGATSSITTATRHTATGRGRGGGGDGNSRGEAWLSFKRSVRLVALTAKGSSPAVVHSGPVFVGSDEHYFDEEAEGDDGEVALTTGDAQLMARLGVEDLMALHHRSATAGATQSMVARGGLSPGPSRGGRSDAEAAASASAAPLRSSSASSAGTPTGELRMLVARACRAGSLAGVLPIVILRYITDALTPMVAELRSDEHRDSMPSPMHTAVWAALGGCGVTIDDISAAILLEREAVRQRRRQRAVTLALQGPVRWSSTSSPSAAAEERGGQGGSGGVTDRGSDDDDRVGRPPYAGWESAREISWRRLTEALVGREVLYSILPLAAQTHAPTQPPSPLSPRVAEAAFTLAAALHDARAVRRVVMVVLEGVERGDAWRDRYDADAIVRVCAGAMAAVACSMTEEGDGFEFNYALLMRCLAAVRASGEDGAADAGESICGLAVSSSYMAAHTARLVSPLARSIRRHAHHYEVTQSLFLSLLRDTDAGFDPTHTTTMAGAYCDVLTALARIPMEASARLSALESLTREVTLHSGEGLYHHERVLQRQLCVLSAARQQERAAIIFNMLLRPDSRIRCGYREDSIGAMLLSPPRGRDAFGLFRSFASQRYPITPDVCHALAAKLLLSARRRSQPTAAATPAEDGDAMAAVYAVLATASPPPSPRNRSTTTGEDAWSHSSHAERTFFLRCLAFMCGLQQHRRHGGDVGSSSVSLTLQQQSHAATVLRAWCDDLDTSQVRWLSPVTLRLLVALHAMWREASSSPPHADNDGGRSGGGRDVVTLLEATLQERSQGLLRPLRCSDDDGNSILITPRVISTAEEVRSFLASSSSPSDEGAELTFVGSGDVDAVSAGQLLSAGWSGAQMRTLLFKVHHLADGGNRILSIRDYAALCDIQALTEAMTQAQQREWRPIRNHASRGRGEASPSASTCSASAAGAKKEVCVLDGLGELYMAQQEGSGAMGDGGTAVHKTVSLATALTVQFPPATSSVMDALSYSYIRPGAEGGDIAALWLSRLLSERSTDAAASFTVTESVFQGAVTELLWEHHHAASGGGTAPSSSSSSPPSEGSESGRPVSEARWSVFDVVMSPHMR